MIEALSLEPDVLWTEATGWVNYFAENTREQEMQIDQRAHFNRKLAYVKKNLTLDEIQMQHSPKAFAKDDREKKPIMLGWEWERNVKVDFYDEQGPHKELLRKILRGPLQLYVNARFEVSDLELVSIPATLISHKKWMNRFLFGRHGVDFSKVVKDVTTDRGIHVHIDKKAFTQESLKKFVTFVGSPKNKVFMNAVAGRDIRRNQWCKPPVVKFVLEKKKIVSSNVTIDEGLDIEGCWDDKGVAVNTMSSFNTVELRIFKTTSTKEVLYRNLEFADALTRFSAVHTFEELTAKDFMGYVVHNKVKYPYLSKDKTLLQLGGLK